jgi:hypothetical protein
MTPSSSNRLCPDDYRHHRLVKLARRVIRRVGSNYTDSLTLNTALASLHNTHYSEKERQIIIAMVQANNNGSLPVPKIGTHYAQRFWESADMRLLDDPYCQDFIARCRLTFKRLLQEKVVSESRLHSILGNHHHYFGRNKVMSFVGGYHFNHGGDPARWPHTPAMLRQIFDDAIAAIKQHAEPLLCLLSDPSNYDKRTDPQLIVERFRHVHHYPAIQILEKIHRLPFGHYRDITGRIHPDELWEGKTVADVINADQRANEESDARYEAMINKRNVRLKELYEITEAVGTYPATVTRALKKQGSAIKLISASKRTFGGTAQIDLAEAGCFSSRSKYLEEAILECRQEYLTMVKNRSNVT